MRENILLNGKILYRVIVGYGINSKACEGNYQAIQDVTENGKGIFKAVGKLLNKKKREL